MNDFNQNNEEGAFASKDNVSVGKQINPVPVPQQELGLDVNGVFMEDLINAGLKSTLDTAQLQSFSTVSQSRDTIYALLDTMAEDATIAAVLETYAEDATEANEAGQIVWCESSNEKIAKFVTFLLDSMNVDKHVYDWIYALCKYGDVYLKLYRNSEYNDDLLSAEQQARNDKFTQLNESIASGGYGDIGNQFNEDIDKPANKENLNEDINVKVYAPNDNYSHYVAMIPNTAEMFELTKFGKTYAYIQAKTTANKLKAQDPMLAQGTYRYSFKKGDIEISDATCFVHASLQDNQSRVPEEVQIFREDTDYDNQVVNSEAYTYRVKRGQSLLYNSFKIWREMTMLENSMLLNRVTRSSVVRIVNVEVGDMPKEQIGPHLQGIKSLMEQKAAINTDNAMSEYTNPGPVENNIYIPTHNQQGTLNISSLGDGEVNPGNLNDINYFRDKLFGCLRGTQKVKLFDGSLVTIKEIYDNLKDFVGKKIRGCSSTGEVFENTITLVNRTDDEKEFIRFTLEDNSVIEVTPEHRMMLSDGTFKMACELTEEDELMSI